MTKLVMNLMTHAMNIESKAELNALRADIDTAYLSGMIQYDVRELLLQMIRKMNYQF